MLSTIFDLLFSPETNCKIVRISALTLFPELRNWFLYKMFFHLAVQFSKYNFGHHASRAGFRRGFFKSFAPSGSLSFTLRRSGFFRSLKTIQVQEEEQSFDHSAFRFVDFLPLRLFSTFVLHTDFSVYRPGMNESVSFFVLSLERR